MGLSILIVDDDKLLVEKLEETVNWSGIGIDMVFTANNIRQAQKLLEEYPIEMLLCDIDMPQGNGLELLEWIRYKKLDIECTFLSSYANFAYAQMALKLSSREYLLKPISNVDLETALRRIVGIVQEKHQKQKKQEKKGENEKQFWEDLLVQCLQEEYWIERAKKSGYCTPDETFRLILLRVLEIPDKEHYKKEISLYNFVITNVLTEYVETTEMKLETVVHVSDLEWAVVLRNHGSAMGTQEELAELRTCLAGAFPARFCMYMGKPAVLDEISKSRDQLEEMEKYVVPDETGILYETRWSFVERDYQEVPWKTYLAEMERSDSLAAVREKLQEYLKKREKSGGLRKDFTSRFFEEMIQNIYVYLKESNIVFGQIFDSEEYETVVHVSDLEWAVVLRNHGSAMGTQEELAELRTCLAGAFPARFCMYMGKPAVLDEISKSRDQLEEMEKYVVPDETGILYETRWSFVERDYQEVPWKTYLAEMERSDSLAAVREKLQEYLKKREKSGGLRKDFTSRFFEEMIQNIYVYLKESNIVFGQIFDSEEYETKRREAVLSVVGAHAFIDYLFDVLEGQKKNESRSDNVVEQLKDYIEQNLNEDLSRSVLAGKVFLSEDYVSKIFMKTTGMSLPNYIAERRIERAKEYLRSSSLPISKIAMEVGYGNFSYFSKTFRELVGCTPNEYRSRQK